MIKWTRTLGHTVTSWHKHLHTHHIQLINCGKLYKSSIARLQCYIAIFLLRTGVTGYCIPPTPTLSPQLQVNPSRIPSNIHWMVGWVGFSQQAQSDTDICTNALCILYVFINCSCMVIKWRTAGHWYQVRSLTSDLFSPRNLALIQAPKVFWSYLSKLLYHQA